MDHLDRQIPPTESAAVEADHSNSDNLQVKVAEQHRHSFNLDTRESQDSFLFRNEEKSNYHLEVTWEKKSPNTVTMNEVEKSQSQSSENTLSIEKTKLAPAINKPVSNNGERTVTIKSTERMSDSASSRSSADCKQNHLRERSFEKSLDNILDKCSEKSVDLSLSVESRNGGHSDVSKSFDDSSIMSSKKSDKKKKSSPWYTVSIVI